jgi:hypothetical protein
MNTLIFIFIRTTGALPAVEGTEPVTPGEQFFKLIFRRW